MQNLAASSSDKKDPFHLKQAKKSINIENSTQEMVKICTWNICGLRAMLKKGTFLQFLLSKSPDILCLNETMLTPKSLSQIQGLLPETYHKYWNHSIKRLGYSGTAIWSKTQPISVQYGLGVEKHDSEGRVLVGEYERFYVVCNYVPSAGRDYIYRVNSWDVDMREFVAKLQKIKPVVWLGDMNVIHQDLDIYNIKGKDTWCCITPQERRNFSQHLELNDMIDVWRYKHPSERGWSYYSRRNVGAYNKGQGWRVDYILVSRVLEPFIHDSYIQYTTPGSDHHPVLLQLKF